MRPRGGGSATSAHRPTDTRATSREKFLGARRIVFTVNEDDAKLALDRSRLICSECGRLDRGERGWTLRLDIDDELQAFCPDCDAYEFG
jgi:hypothetical protein